MTTSVPSNTLTVQPPRVLFKTEVVDNLRQDSPGQAPALLALPKEILEKIVTFVATGGLVVAAKQALKWSRVCVFANVLTRTPTMVNVINLGKTAFTKWIPDPDLPQIVDLVDGHGKVIQTTKMLCHV